MGGIALGNLSISEFEKRTGWKLSKDDRKWLNSHRVDSMEVDALSNAFHIFDIPFMIQVADTISTKLNTLIRKYEQFCPSKDKLSISVITESEYDRLVRLRHAQQQELAEKQKNNLKSVWTVNWKMLIPVKVVNDDGIQKNLYYGVFITTHTTGRINIPKYIDGKIIISKDSAGFHGQFQLYDSKTHNDADEFNHNWVNGIGFYHLSGSHIGCLDSFYFDEIECDIKTALEEYEMILGVECNEIFFEK